MKTTLPFAGDNLGSIVLEWVVLVRIALEGVLLRELLVREVLVRREMEEQGEALKEMSYQNDSKQSDITLILIQIGQFA